MNTLERHARYADQRGIGLPSWLDEDPVGLTPAQRRRMRRKARARKTHSHVASEPCLRCRPPAQPEKVPFRPWK